MRLLMLTPNPLEPVLAGPLQRQWETAAALARAGHTVTLAGTRIAASTLAPDGVTLADSTGLPALVRAHDAVIAAGAALTPTLRRAAGHRPILADCIAPEYFEVLADHSPAAGDPQAAVKTQHLAFHQRARHAAVIARLRVADRYLVGSKPQRDLLVGWLAAARLISAERGTHRCPPDDLVAVVPNGVGEPPAPCPDARRRIPGLHAADTVCLWWGSAYDWYDLATVLDAFVALAPQRPGLKLVLGALHPPHQPVPSGVARLLARPEVAALCGRTIVVLPEWVPYAERGDILQAADAGIYAHQPTWESRYAVRTRFYDYLWAGLPVLISDGDCHAESVRAHGLGAVLPPGDRTAWQQALVRLADDSGWRHNCRHAAAGWRAQHTWDAAIAPLLQLLTLPRPVPPRRPPVAAYAGYLAGRWRATWHTGGWRAVAGKTLIHIGKMLRG